MANKIILTVLMLLALNFRAAFAFDADTKIADVINYPAFKNYGQLIFPVNKNYYSGDTLKNLRLTWYSNINPARTVEIVNYMLENSENIFRDVKTEIACYLVYLCCFDVNE